MNKRGEIFTIILFVSLIVVAVSAGVYYYKNDVQFAPDDGVCDPGEDANSEDCAGEISCDPSDPSSSCYCDSNDPEGECYSPPPCTGVTPDSQCVDANGKFIEGVVDKCKYCDPCGVANNAYRDGPQPEIGVCEVCSDGEIAFAGPGTSISGKDCSVCDGAGGEEPLPDGTQIMECNVCKGGEAENVNGNLPGDDDGLICKKCSGGLGIDKMIGDVCNEKIIGFGKSTLLPGECDIDEDLVDLMCFCNTVDCQAGGRKAAVPSLDPINDKIGYVECVVIHSDDEGDPTCSMWPPEPEGVTACNTCSQKFDSAEGCKNLDKAGKRALKGESCKYKSWFGLGSIKSGTCNGAGSCKKGGFALFSWVVDAFGNALDRTEEIIDYAEKCQNEAIRQGADSGTWTPWRGYIQGPEGTTFLRGFKCSW